MAKRKPIAVGTGQQPIAKTQDATAQSFFTRDRIYGLAAGLIAASVVFSGYWPADSTAVQMGGARYLAGILVLAGGLAVAARPLWDEPGIAWADRWIDIAALGLALSMAVSTWMNAEVANVRLGINEMWWWFAAAALFLAARRICHSRVAKRAFLNLLVAVTVAVAVFGWHQQWIGIPAMIQMYEQDPDEVLRGAGIEAAEGSGLRIVFRNRLYDGGPTGTFALANSMAAFLVGGLVVIVGTLLQRWPDATRPQKAGWFIAVLVVSTMVIASRSRSALGALLIVAVVAATQRWFRGKTGTILKISTGACAAFLTIATLGWIFFKDTEWVGQAPASLEVRLRYWIASIKMIAQSPWFGVGPGQFKARYELYRADISTEQIADPHNWFWQIATTGGLISAAIAVGLFITLLWSARTGSSRRPSELKLSAGSIYTGAAVALAIAWLVGLAFGQLPSLDACVFATLAGASVFWLAIRSDHDSPFSRNPPVKMIAFYAFIAMLIDLTAAGGLIVPGVAIPMWLLIAIATTPTIDNESSADSIDAAPPALIDASGNSPRWTRLVVSAVAILILGVWYTTAILPVEKANIAKGQFEAAWQAGRLAEAESALRQASLADPWDAESVLQLASLLTQAAVSDSQNHQRWEASLTVAQDEAIRRAGRDPVPLRLLSDGQLRLYQRYGSPQALRSAMVLMELATQLAPAHEAYAAQLAEIYRQMEDDRASQWAQRAMTLAAAGGYYERSLPFVLVMPAEHLGEQVANKEIRRPASEILPPILETSHHPAGRSN